MRDAREGMQSDENVPARYRDELLRIHANGLLKARRPFLALTLAMPILLAPFVGTTGRIALLLWIVVALGVQLVGERVAARFASAAADGENLAAWTGRFTLVQTGHGMVWALFILIAHPLFGGGWGAAAFGTPGLPGPVVLGVMLVIGSVHLFASHALHGGVAWICVLSFLSCAILLAPAAAAGDGGAAASLLGAATLAVMFSLLGIRLLDYARGNVRAELGKEHAVLEFEEARNLSDEARRRAEEANMAKTRFLSTMSHELRTPLNAILGFSEIIEQEVMGPIGNPKYKEYVADIHSSGTHLLKLINEILDLSRVEAGRYELHEEPVALVGIAEEAMQMVKLKANEKGLTLQIRAERTLPDVFADERAVRQIVLNLLSNAVKFTPKGGQVVVKVGWTGSGGQYVSVSDNGPGIARDEIPIVLSSFGQGSVALRVAEPGSGLGLPIVQALMKIHDGRFDLQSKLREGTAATVIFPRKRVMMAEQPRVLKAG